MVLLLIGGLVRCSRSDSNSDSEQVQTPPDTTATAAVVPVVEPNSEPPVKSLVVSKKVGNLSKQFADLNDAHLVYAQKYGIKPIATTSDIMKIKRPIVEIRSNENYHIDKLTHSYPYLVPEAKALLDTIGYRFKAKLQERGGGNYKIKVTSLLRTYESIQRLQHGNVNSTVNSAHLYGTTFDISYVDFREGHFNTVRHTDGELKNLLAEVLLELREQGRCLVKFEHKQSCFHITVAS